MTTATAAAAARPQQPQLQRIDGQLFIDMDNYRARYECYRPGCPQPMEGPVFATDRDAEGRRIGAEGLKAWFDSAKENHLSQHHGSNR